MAAPLLVLTDFRQPANRALAYASTLAAVVPAPLVVLHVRRTATFDAARFTGQTTPRSVEAVSLALHSLTDQLTVPAVAEVQQGQVVETVAAAVEQHRPGLLVLGRPDTEELPDELATTTALELLPTVACPMLVVPPQGAAAAPRRVLVAADAEAFSLGPHAPFIRHLLDTLGAELTVLHVSPGPDPAGTAAAAAAVQAADLTSQVPPLHPLLRPDVAPAILEQAARGTTDLVVLVARPRSFLSALFHRSVTAQVLLHCPVPVLVLPAR